MNSGKNSSPGIKNLIRVPAENTGMNGNLRFGMFLCLLVIAAVLIAGCSDQSDNTVTTTATTAAPQALYSAGDIIAKTAAGSVMSVTNSPSTALPATMSLRV